MTKTTSQQGVSAVPTTEGPAWDTFQSLLARAKHPSKKAHLRHVWDALEVLRGQRPKVFTVAAVCRQLAESKHPLAQSTVRNQQGADYRTLISAYASQCASARNSMADDADAMLDGITDAHIAVRIKQLQAERNAFKRQVDIMHARFQELATMAPAASPAPHGPPARATLTAGSSGFAARDVAAVRRFLDTGIADLGWRIDEPSGAVLDKHGSEVAGPGFVSALRRIVGSET